MGEGIGGKRRNDRNSIGVEGRAVGRVPLLSLASDSECLAQNCSVSAMSCSAVHTSHHMLIVS